MESNQDIPECLENFKPRSDPDAPLFEDDEDDEDDEDNNPSTVPPTSVTQGAAWDAADTSVVFLGDAVRIPTFPSFHPSCHSLHSLIFTRC